MHTPKSEETLDKTVHGLLFDLDNTLIDREAAFVRFASRFYDERLRYATTMTRDEVVTKMVLWDQDGYADRETMFAQWINEWPKSGNRTRAVATLLPLRNETTRATRYG